MNEIDNTKSSWQKIAPILQSGKKYFFHLALEVILNAVVIATLVIFTRFFIMAPFQVDGPSMLPNLENKDYILINKIGYSSILGLEIGSPQRGDIVVLRPPTDPSVFYVKRVIGLPKDKIEIKNGNVYIYNLTHPEGFQVDEPYLSEENVEHTYLPGRSASDSYILAEDQYFVMGDNRVHSNDSREWVSHAPFVHRNNIEGKVMFIFWPPPKIQIVHGYSYKNEILEKEFVEEKIIEKEKKLEEATQAG